MRQITGARIRDRRLDRGMSQTDLARAAGISASYLNLIEHNRRRIGGKLLRDIARLLEADPGVLSDAAEPALIEALGLAAASLPATDAEVARAEDFAMRFPGWAGVVASQAERIARLEAALAAMGDRLAHDPQLEASLHEVVSVATSIRSTASILVAGEGVDPDWQGRFHQNLHSDSRRLAEGMQSLATYLDAPLGGLRGPGGGMNPGEELRAFQAEVAAGGAPVPPVSPLVRAMAQAWLQTRHRAEEALPMARLEAAAARLGHDPGVLAAKLGVDLALVLRRMADLPPGEAHPPMGLAVCDAAGGLTEFRAVAGFAAPQGAAACPLWPLFQALTAPGLPVRAVVAMPADAAPRLTCYALAGPVGPASFDAPPRIEAVMLVVADAPDGPARPVGRTCRICPRPDCAARREPSILPAPAPARHGL